MIGPVVMTGAGGQVGTALRRRLSELPVEVRALTRGDDLAPAVRDAGALVHLAGSLRLRASDTYSDAIVGTTKRAIAALEGSTVERVILLSYVGASRSSPNAYLRAKAEAEDVLHHSGLDYVIFRCTHIVGPPDDPGPTASALLARRGRAVWVLGDGTQRVAPVYREDVVDAIAAALDPRTHHGRFELPGPDELTMDEFVTLLNGGAARLHHVPALVARTLGRTHPGLTPELVDLMLADSLGDQIRAMRAFGLRRHRLADVYPHAALAA